MKLKYKIWLDNAGKAFGEGPYQLLLGVQKHGSLAQAAKDLNMSYSRAHGLMKHISANLGFPLIESQAGGAGGGGTQITEQANTLMRCYEAFMQEGGSQLEQLYEKHFGALLGNAEQEAPESQDGAAQEADALPEQPTYHLSPHLEPLHLAPQEVVALVGGGGKTSIMYALAEELSLGGAKVLLTTTTRIYLPEHGRVDRLVVSDELGILDQLRQGLKPRDIVALGTGVHGGKLDGLTPEFIDKLADLAITDYILVEADGAAGLPFKAPGQNEPVIPHVTSTVLNVVGIDALGAVLSEETCHRPSEISRISGLPLGGVVSGEVIAQVLSSREGGRKNVPTAANWLPVINKIDREEDVPKAVQIARALVKFGVQDVVFASTLGKKLTVRLWSSYRQEQNEN